MLESIARSRRDRLALLGVWGILVAAVSAAAWVTGVSWLVALALVPLGAGTAVLAKSMFELATDVGAPRSTVDDQSARTAKVRWVQAARLDRLARARDRHRSQIAELRVDVDGLDLLSEGLEALAGGLAELRSEVAALAPLSDRIDVLAGDLEKAARERAGMADSVADALQAMRDIVANERRSRALDLARQRSSGVMPQRLLLQMTVPRTASTQLFEVLRANPSVYVEPLAFIWTALFTSGRRYPTALSDVPNASVPLEASPGRGCFVRPMQPQDHRRLDPPVGPVALEKAHPEFFAFDVDAFRRSLDQLSAIHGVEIQFVYQVRQPLEVMWSFAEYKARSPRWYAHLPVDEVPAYITRSFRALAELQETHPGVVVDFGDIHPGSDSLRRLGRLLTPEATDAAIDKWLAGGFEGADLEVAHQASFVGDRDAQRGPDGPGGAWMPHGELIEQANATYERLVSG